MVATQDKNSPKRILIIRLGAMGDVLLTTPVIRMLSDQYPDARIDFLVKETFAPLVQYHPGLHTIWRYNKQDPEKNLNTLIAPLQAVSFDWVIDLQNNLRSRRLVQKLNVQTDIFRPDRWKRLFLVLIKLNLYRNVLSVPDKYLNALKTFPIPDDGKGLDLYQDPQTSDQPLQHEAGFDHQKPVLAMAPGAGRDTKRWLPTRFAETADILIRNGYDVTLIGGENDRAVCRDVQNRMLEKAANFCGQFSLLQTAAMLKKCHLLITNDTGVMHMAAATQTPVLALFGPTTHHFGFWPYRVKAHVIESELRCRPCSFHGTNKCPRGHFLCMRNIHAPYVAEVAMNMINSF